MDVKKIVVLLAIGVFFVGVVFSSGCTDFGTGEDVGGITGGDIYIGGSQGLGITFPPNRPPSEIYGNSPFQLAFKLDNLGEYTIENVNNNIIIYLSGINPTTYGFSSMQGSPAAGDLEGKKKVGDTEVPGGTTEVVFDSTGYAGTSIPPGGEWTQTIQGRVCYNYETNVISKVCLKQNIYEESVGTAACTIKGAKQTESSGAPIKVTSIEETPSGAQEVTFKVEISNVGGGVPYNVGLSQCDSLSIGDEDKIHLDSMALGTIPLNCDSGCDPSGVIQLYNNKATILVSADLSGGGYPTSEYEDILEMTFDYNYFKDISKQIKIIGT